MTGEHRQPFPASPPQTGFLRSLEEVRGLLPTWETGRLGENYIYIKFWILFFSPRRSVVSKNNFNGNEKLMSPFGLHNRILSHQTLLTLQDVIEDSQKRRRVHGWWCVTSQEGWHLAGHSPHHLTHTPVSFLSASLPHFCTAEGHAYYFLPFIKSSLSLLWKFTAKQHPHFQR